MQQDCLRISNDYESKLYCEVHPENELQIIHLGTKHSQKSRMLCVQCIIESCNKKENLNQYIYLHNFMIDPKNTILQIINIDSVSQQNLSKSLEQIDKLLIQFEEMMRNQLVKIKENIHQMRIQQDEIIQEFSYELKLNQVVRQIQFLKQMDSFQGTNELNNLENNLNFLSENLIKAYNRAKDKGKNNQQLNAAYIFDCLQILSKQIDSLAQQCKDFSVKEEFLDFKILEDVQDFPQILSTISEGKNIECQLLYQGTRDGLNAQSYWAKCNLQQHLLTIMTSKTGNKFGGYSPCQINQQINTFVKDPTMKSFIFQYNKKEIYKLKIIEQAIWCQSNYGPLFGENDIYIGGDFISGFSKLGNSYDLSSYNILDKANHIFGATQPQLQECKVQIKYNYF